MNLKVELKKLEIQKLKAEERVIHKLSLCAIAVGGGCVLIILAMRIFL